MRINPKLTKLNSPQKTSKGKTRKNKDGEDLYTTYAKLNPVEKRIAVKHMTNTLKEIRDIIEAIGLDEFKKKVDYNKKEQLDNEPETYSYADRVVAVYERLSNENEKGKDLTTGFIDMYNRVVEETYNGIGHPNEVKKLQVDYKGNPPKSQNIFNDLFD